MTSGGEDWQGGQRVTIDAHVAATDTGERVQPGTAARVIGENASHGGRVQVQTEDGRLLVVPEKALRRRS